MDTATYVLTSVCQHQVFSLVHSKEGFFGGQLKIFLHYLEQDKRKKTMKERRRNLRFVTMTTSHTGISNKTPQIRLNDVPAFAKPHSKKLGIRMHSLKFRVLFYSKRRRDQAEFNHSY